MAETHAPARDPAIRTTAGTPAGTPAASAGADPAGDRFLAELGARTPDSARPLPHALQAMATALAGRRRPVVVAGPSTRAALAAVGKRAATVGDRIFLPAPLPRSSDRRASVQANAAAEVVAHELVHVAARSNRPRFFGGNHGSEEHRAHAAGQAAARATAKATKTLAVGGSVMVVRSAAGATTPPAAVPTPAPRAPVPTPAPGPMVQRHFTVQRGDPAAPDTPGPATATGQTTTTARVPSNDTTPTAALSSTALLNRLDELMEAVEERVLAEIERRGGRFAAEF